MIKSCMLASMRLLISCMMRTQREDPARLGTGARGLKNHWALSGGRTALELNSKMLRFALH